MEGIEQRAVAVVTGGAGGLGSSICRKLADAGMCVVVGYHRSAEAAHQLATSLAGQGHSARPAPVTQSAQMTELAAEIGNDYGRCDVLVNCAGVTRFVRHADLEALDDELIDNILATNVRGAFASVRAFRHMLERSPLPGGGVVVNLSSAAGTLAMGSNVIYCASKAALDNMMKSMEPGWHHEQAARTPLGRLATPEEVANAVVAAITTLTFVTGSILLVDGGRSLACTIDTGKAVFCVCRG